MEWQGTLIAKTVFKKKNKVVGLRFPDSKTYKVRVLKQWYWHKDRHADQWDRIQSPEINPAFMINWFSTNVPTSLTGRKDSLSIKQSWDNCISIGTRMKLNPDLTPYTKINSKLIKHLNTGTKIITLLEENTEIILCALLSDHKCAQ